METVSYIAVASRKLEFDGTIYIYGKERYSKSYVVQSRISSI